jgi:3-hydroxyisobutyrate dehydrogenase
VTSERFAPAATTIGWIGLGVMGSSMCSRLIEAGYSAIVHNRTRAKAEPLLKRGARWADSPREVAAAAEVIFSIVGYPADVRQVILREDGALAGCREGSVLVDMTTSRPALAEEIAAAAAKRGVTAIDAPVSGGDVGAKSGKLSIMIGGDEATVESLAPCWNVMGATWVRHGEAGAGQHAKMVNQTLIGGNMVGVCEALLYAHRAGLDLDRVLESVASGAAGSWSLSNLGPRIIRGDFAPGFFVEHFIKDMGIILEEARRMDLKLPGVELAELLYRELAAQGHARAGTQSLLLALAKLSGIEWNATKQV